MTWEYRECDVVLEIKPERQLMSWLHDGWELVGLHRKNRRGKTVVVAIMRRQSQPQPRTESRTESAPVQRVEVQLA